MLWGRDTPLCQLGENENQGNVSIVIKRLQEYSTNLGQTYLLAFFQLNHKISRVQGRQQMLIYLDFGTAAREIAKNGSNRPK